MNRRERTMIPIEEAPVRRSSLRSSYSGSASRIGARVLTVHALPSSPQLAGSKRDQRLPGPRLRIPQQRQRGADPGDQREVARIPGGPERMPAAPARRRRPAWTAASDRRRDGTRTRRRQVHASARGVELSRSGDADAQHPAPEDHSGQHKRRGLPDPRRDRSSVADGPARRDRLPIPRWPLTGG